jgi:hypothetical protein
MRERVASAGPAQAWTKEIHPIRAMLAVKLSVVTLTEALKNATWGQHAFLVNGTVLLPLKILDKDTSAPSPEMFFTLNSGKVRSSRGKSTFKAVRVNRRDPRLTPSLMSSAPFEVVGQLRANYASRVLQLTGAHLARIGIDFFNFGV